MMEKCKMWCDKVDMWAPVIARVFIAIVFIMAGYQKVMGFSGLASNLGTALKVLPGTAWALLAVVFELGGALLLLAGYKTRLASWMLIIFTVIATLIVHTSMLAPAGVPFQVDWVSALKNLAIIGGLLLVAKHGADKMSMDNKMMNRGMTGGMGM
jgi:putative oxidoreductase